jgi:hypothetical protein
VVERRAGLQPLELVARHGVPRRDLEDVASLALRHADPDGDVLACEEVREPKGLDDVAGADAAVVGLVGEPQRQDTLLLQVRLVDACEGAGDDDRAACGQRSDLARDGRIDVRTVEAGLERSVFTGAAFAVVFVDDERPGLAAGLETLGDARDGVSLRLRGIVLVVESDVYVSSLIIHGLDGRGQVSTDSFRHQFSKRTVITIEVLVGLLSTHEGHNTHRGSQRCWSSGPCT